jgi:hypothetical protein
MHKPVHSRISKVVFSPEQEQNYNSANNLSISIRTKANKENCPQKEILLESGGKRLFLEPNRSVILFAGNSSQKHRGPHFADQENVHPNIQQHKYINFPGNDHQTDIFHKQAFRDITPNGNLNSQSAKGVYVNSQNSCHNSNHQNYKKVQMKYESPENYLRVGHNFNQPSTQPSSSQLKIGLENANLIKKNSHVVSPHPGMEDCFSGPNEDGQRNGNFDDGCLADKFMVLEEREGYSGKDIFYSPLRDFKLAEEKIVSSKPEENVIGPKLTDNFSIDFNQFVSKKFVLNT